MVSKQAGFYQPFTQWVRQPIGELSVSQRFLGVVELPMLNMREYVAWVVGLAGVPFSGGRGGGAPEYQRPVPLQRLAQQPAASSTKRCYTPSRKGSRASAQRERSSYM